MSQPTNCRVCGHPGPHATFQVREMMLGTRDVFDYFECSGCGTVQLAEIPANLASFYPSDYYSFHTLNMPPTKGVRLLLKKLRADYILTGRGVLGKLLVKKFGYWHKYDWLRAAGAQRSDAVLDIGCGSGETLLRLRDDGFANLTGADPFVSAPVEYPGAGHVPVRVLKCAAPDITGQYDLVMMDHSFEHVPNPAEVMAAVARLLRPGGRAIVGVPIAGWAWRHYRTDWVQLDAPRHLFIFTTQSFGMLAEKSGLEIKKTIFDSESFQFTGSEMYRRDIPLTRVDPDGVRRFNSAADYFTSAEMTTFASRAKDLNTSGDGDRACFILGHAG